jgi:hypothetical protein
VKNRRKKIGIEEILDVRSQLEKGEQIVDICHNVRLSHLSVPTVRNNDDRINENTKSGNLVFV